MGDHWDDVIRYNRERWNALAQANVVFSRPFLDLDEESARAVVDRQGLLGDVAGREVLCLAGGGGQQSAAFALLGANVTVFDLSDTQLERDRAAAEHYGHKIHLIQGDMRDLSALAQNSFDVVWHAFSISFVPEAVPTLKEVARVLRPGGRYRMEWSNPFVGALDESKWAGDGYRLNWPYIDGAEIPLDDPHWDIDDGNEQATRVVGPREFRHSLSTIVNTLVGLGFIIQGIWEELTEDPEAEPGTWEHLKLIAPPWLTLWCRYRPDVMDALASE